MHSEAGMTNESRADEGGSPTPVSRARLILGSRVLGTRSARYGASAVAWVAALGITLALFPYVQRANFMFFWIAVLFAAYVAGLVPAMIAAFASVAAVNFYLVQPRGEFTALSPADVLTFAIFVFASALVSALAARLARVTGSLRAEVARNQARASSEAAARSEAERTAEEARQAAAMAELARTEADAARREAERAQLEAETARQAAEAANTAKIHFLATMSHELRTPLNAIQGHVQLIEFGVHGPITDKQRDALSRVDRAQRHLLGLVNDVLNYARLVGGGVVYELEPVELSELMDEVLPMVEPQLAAKGLAFELRLPARGTAPDPPALAKVMADREKLIQILLNLLSNAIKFTPNGGRVAVELLTPKRGVDTTEPAYIRVVDTGIGIPRDRLEAVFEPFVQVRAGLTRPHEGTGLGLAISRDLARGMGGDLRARSEEGRGSTFTITLRRAPVTAEHAIPG
jgi:signal transduction histidine kinase